VIIQAFVGVVPVIGEPMGSGAVVVAAEAVDAEASKSRSVPRSDTDHVSDPQGFPRKVETNPPFRHRHPFPGVGVGVLLPTKKRA
jgi:hypothetical protein